ncbi:DNA-directed RNA polymerase II core subunit [Savitreella phatthalungensis]
MNAPERYELILVPEGVSKLTVTPDAKLPNCVTIKFEKEDHTLGNLLRAQLLKDSRVLFAAYRVEHPLDHSFILRIQTIDGIEPKDAVSEACRTILIQLDQLKQRFDSEWELKKISGEGMMY